VRLLVGALTVILASGCGRVGYDLLGGDDDVPPDGDGGTGGGDGGGGDGGGGPGPDARVDGGASGACAEVADYCAAIPALAGPPVIDGSLDCGGLRPVVPVGWNGMGSAPPAGDASEIALAWAPDGLYVFVRVTDASRVPAPSGQDPYCGDAIELFVDADGAYPSAPGFDEPGTRAFIVVAPPTDVSPSTRAESFGAAGVLAPWTSSQWGAYPVAGGYVVEAFIGAADLGLGNWPLGAGATVGFDLSHDVSAGSSVPGPCMSRIGQYFLRVTAAAGGCGGEPFCDVGAFCTPTLLAP
jgi:hypothetical protein